MAERGLPHPGQKLLSCFAELVALLFSCPAGFQNKEAIHPIVFRIEYRGRETRYRCRTVVVVLWLSLGSPPFDSAKWRGDF